MSDAPYLGIDIGFKRTGLALSESGLLARPLGTVTADPPHMARAIEELADTVLRHEVRTLVAGMPYSEDGAPTEQSERVKGIVARLESRLKERGANVTIVTANEYRTTRESADLYPDAEPDAAAAALILQDYLDAR